MNDNAYKVKLLGEYGVHATFNVGDLSPYIDDGLTELRSIPCKWGGDEACMNDDSPITIGCDDQNKLKGALAILVPISFRKPTDFHSECIGSDSKRFDSDGLIGVGYFHSEGLGRKRGVCMITYVG